MSINSTKIKFSFLLLFFCLPFFFLASTTSALTEKQIKEYSYNNIYFVENCIPSSGNFSSICGNTPKEKYWSALRKEFDEIHTAAMFGSIDHEGFFGPTLWQYNLVPAGSGRFSGVSWDQLYNCAPGSCPGGIGVFQITWMLGPYLQHINSQNPDLIQYFKDPSYSLPGDQALEKIGATDYDRLVQQELDYVLNSIDKASFKSITDLDAATDWWTKNYENCSNCCGSADADHSCEQIALRRASAHKEYDEMKDFTCSGSYTSDDTTDSTTSSDSSHTSGSFSNDSNVTGGITWIGDSYSVGANAKGLLPSGTDLGSGSPDTASSNIQVSKFVSSGDASNPSCLTILENIIKAGNLQPNLVFACGTNGGWSDSDITKFENLLKGQDVKVAVTNSKIPSNDYADSNKRLQKLADTNDNISLADWVSVYSDDYFASDPEKLHPNTDPGYSKWVEAIMNALGNTSSTTSTDNSCAPSDEDGSESSNDVLAAVQEIIELANKNGSTYTWGGGHTTDKSVFDAMLSGSPINVDCTGFASLVMYKTFGKMTSFTSYSIFGDPLYEEVDRSDVQPGDVFAYNSPSGHGGIVIEAKNGKVTKIAETGGPEGKKGGNTNIGYSNSGDFSVQNMNGPNGHFFRFKK